MGLGRVKLVLASFESSDAHVVELGQEIVLVVVAQLLEEVVGIRARDLLVGRERYALRGGTEARSIQFIGALLVKILLKAALVASWLLRSASLLEGVTAGSISQASLILIVHPVVRGANHWQHESLGTLRIDHSATDADTLKLSSS